MDIKNNEDKAWVTLSQIVNLGDYENVKIEVGYSQTIKDGENPIEKIKAMEDELEDFLVRKVEEIKGVDTKISKPKRKRRKRE